MSHPIGGDALYRRDLPLDAMQAPFVLAGGVCESKVPLQLTPHSHPGFELHCFASGTMEVCLPEGVQLAAHGGETMIVQPGVMHHGPQNVVMASQHAWLVIDPLAAGAGWTTAEGMQMTQLLRQAGNSAKCAEPWATLPNTCSLPTHLLHTRTGSDFSLYNVLPSPPVLPAVWPALSADWERMNWCALCCNLLAGSAFSRS